ncbi:MAG: ABC transporter permease [Candidatus Polarisedimenticolia bacterium]
MSQILQVARREFLETARSKWFVIGTVAFPLLLGALMFVPVLMVRSGGGTTRCVVVDETGVLLAPLREAVKNDEMLKRFELIEEPGQTDLEQLRQAVSREEHDAVLHLPAGVLTDGTATFYARGLSIATERLDRVLTKVVTGQRLAASGLDPSAAQAATRPVEVESFQIGKGGIAEKKNWGQVYIATMSMVMLLYFTIAIYGVTLMNSTVQEKSSRVMEVLLSTTSPFELMAGKMLGKGSAALTQMSAWSLTGLAFVLYGAASGSQGIAQIASSLPPAVFGAFLLFFVLGFFTMGSVYTALGSTCNSPEEASQLQFPAVLPLMASLMLSFLIISQPDNAVGVVLSMVPFLSPILMFVRIVVRTPPIWQILLAVVVNLATIVGTIWLAARIYRVGVLMYGKRPTLPEIVRWARSA